MWKTGSVTHRSGAQGTDEERCRLRSMIVDLMHLIVVVAGLAVGAWSLIALRTRLPRGRFVIFASSSVAALFGCAAVGGEVGHMSQSAWFSLVMVLLVALALSGYVTGRRPRAWR